MSSLPSIGSLSSPDHLHSSLRSPPSTLHSRQYLLRPQQTETNNCVGTPIPFFQTDFPLQLNPLSQSHFPSTVYQGAPSSSIPSMGISARRSGGRRPKEMDNMYDDMDADEVDKKVKRRQRNKEAAARCRARRLQLMSELQEKVDQFKREAKNKREEISQLSEKVLRLQQFLRSHECKMSEDERQKIINNCGVANNVPINMNTSRGGYTTSGASSSSRTVLPPPSIPPVSHHIQQPQQPNQIENTYPGQLRHNAPRDSADYFPQYDSHRGTKRSHGDESNQFIQGGGQPQQKLPKIEMPDQELMREKTLTQINSREELERPGEFKLDSIGSISSGCGPVPLTTPSRDIPFNNGAPTFSSFGMPSFGGGVGAPSNILNQTTGLTPIASSGMSAFSLGANTPLGTNDLKNL